MIHRILLIDDDKALSEILSTALTEEGFSVESAPNGAAGLKKLEAHPPDLAILDVLMPELDGLEVCRRIRRGPHKALPVILLTSRSEEIDRVTGLETGADDYVTKPFSTRELIARIRAIARRLSERTLLAEPSERTQLGALAIDRARFEVRWNGHEVRLTRSEFDVLSALATRQGRVLSREQLIELVRGGDVVITERTVDTFIKRIRKKLREADDTFDEIETLVGVGYRYRSPGE